MSVFIKFLVSADGQSLECVRVLNEDMLLPMLMYMSETMVQFVKMNNLRNLLNVRRIDKMRTENVKGLCGVRKDGVERINVNVKMV